jgi:hypothetical protein
MKYAWVLALIILYGLLYLNLQNRRIEAFEQSSYTLPKIIWTHWQDKNFPDYLEKNIARWKKFNPDWQVNLLTTDDFLAIVPKEQIPSRLKDLIPQHQADWIRLKLLNLHGGCWIDSGILLNSSLNPLYDECLKTESDLLMFKINSLTTNSDYPVGENWFLMAPQASPVISLWLQEFHTAISMGFLDYKKSLQSEKVDTQKIFGADDDTYLTMHGAFQKVIQKLLEKPKIVYKTAEDSMFKIQSDCNWKKECTDAFLQDKSAVQRMPYIKLRGYDRQGVNILPLLEE